MLHLHVTIGILESAVQISGCNIGQPTLFTQYVAVEPGLCGSVQTLLIHLTCLLVPGKDLYNRSLPPLPECYGRMELWRHEAWHLVYVYILLALLTEKRILYFCL